MGVAVPPKTSAEDPAEYPTLVTAACSAVFASARFAIDPAESATVVPLAVRGPPVSPVPVAIEIDCNAVAASARSAFAPALKSTVNAPVPVMGVAVPPKTITDEPAEYPTLVTTPDPPPGCAYQPRTPEAFVP